MSSTHAQVSKWELPVEDIQARYPQVEGFHFVSSFTGKVRTDVIVCVTMINVLH